MSNKMNLQYIRHSEQREESHDLHAGQSVHYSQGDNSVTASKSIRPLLVLLAICLFGRPAEAEYGGGTGQPDDPYLIYTAEQMNEIGANWKDWDKHFKLMADIDLSTYAGTDFNIIGRSRMNAFSGVFDGNSKKISNFMYSSANRDYAGLFGYFGGSKAEIRNLGFIDPYIDVGSGTCVGSLVGYAYEGSITNCYVKGGSISGKKYVGGLIGYGPHGNITNCHAEGGSVSGNKQVGGLVGSNQAGIEDCYSACSVSGNRAVGGLAGTSGGKIANSYATGMVSASEYSGGGLVGSNSGPVTNCSAAGDVLGGGSVGGLVGQNSGPVTNCSAAGDVLGSGRRVGGLVGSNGGTITNSCSRGNTSGEDSVGGLVGHSHGATISNCYATGIVSGDQNVGGLVGVNSNGPTLEGNGLPGRIVWLSGRIAYCYSVGSVTGTTDVGGLVGLNNESQVSYSFWDIQTSGLSNMCGRQEQGTGCNDANGKTTAEMQMESMFLDAGWDFVAENVNGTEDFWSICEGLDYPKLASQFLIGDFDGDSRVDLSDFAVLAARWLSSDSSFFWCRGADLANDGIVDFNDLKKFVENWLADDIGSPAAIRYVIIDDFESYNDLDPNRPESNRIFDTWLDGYYNRATNGSVVGYNNPPFTEQSIVHGGSQSMPYFYSTFFKFSKAELPLSPPQDWTEEGVGVLSLWFYGDASNAPASMSIVLNGGAPVYHDNPNTTQIDTWTGWTIDLQAFAGVDLTSINSIAICFGDRNNLQPGGSGKMLFDDIRVYRPR
ncbi:MAG: GLUG motif-containing protein [Phycisphaerales bacterium]